MKFSVLYVYQDSDGKTFHFTVYNIKPDTPLDDVINSVFKKANKIFSEQIKEVSRVVNVQVIKETWHNEDPLIDSFHGLRKLKGFEKEYKKFVNRLIKKQ